SDIKDPRDQILKGNISSLIRLRGYLRPYRLRMFLALIALAVSSSLVLGLATYARYYLVSWVGEKTIADIRRDVYNRVIRLDTAFFETTRTGELLSRITTDTTLLQTVVGSSLSMALRN